MEIEFDTFNRYLNHEIYVNVFVQENFAFLEPIFQAFAIHLGPTRIIYILLPILYCHDMIILTKTVVCFSICDLTVAILKWLMMMDRPYWWTRENNGPHLKQYSLTCESTSGFPSAHSIIATMLAYSSMIIIMPHIERQFKNNVCIPKVIIYVIMSSLIVLMWMCRLFYACHFLHQCVFGSILGITITNIMFKSNHGNKFFYAEQSKYFIALLGAAGIIVASHFHHLQNGSELRSVKMAFQWCEEPTYLQHDNSPVYWLGRSFGLVLGIALSAPLNRRFQIYINPSISIPLTALLVGIHYAFDLYTPKNYGRIAFVAYGLVRSTSLTYCLLNIVPLISGSIKL